MKFGSLFAGIGGFDLGLERAGMECAWQVEIDPHCRAVLGQHWPDVPCHEDVSQVGSDNLGTVDLICGGFPCQDVSVAGRRAGLAGARSGLFYQFMRIVAELAPTWVLIENVPGLLSSNGGRDMGAVLGALGDLGYGWTYRVLDSQYFGVPQRRRRVFIVGHAGGVCPPEILFEPESLPGDSPPGREEGAPVAASLTRGTESAGRGGYAGRRREDDMNLVAGTLDSNHGNVRADQAWTGRLVAVATAFNWKSGGDCRIDPQEERSGTLQVQQVPAVAFSVNQRREGRMGDVHGSLHEPSGTQVDGVLALDIRNQRGGETMDTMVGGGGGNTMPHLGAPVPRRLTAAECERLQAFPDDWTRYDANGQELKDSPRYRILGNAVTVSVAEWIGQRIMQAEATQ